MDRRLLHLAALGTAFALSLVTTPPPAQADPPIASELWYTCKPVETMIVLGKRFHVKCETGWYNPSTGLHFPYFAIAASDAAQVEQAMHTAQAAQTSGKHLRLFIKTSSSYNPPGCQTDDCRTFLAIGLVD